MELVGCGHEEQERRVGIRCGCAVKLKLKLKRSAMTIAKSEDNRNPLAPIYPQERNFSTNSRQ